MIRISELLKLIKVGGKAMRLMTDEEIEKWIDDDKPYDKAGGYAVQSAFGVHIEKINGNFFTVMGLPIHKLYDMLKNI